MALLACALVRLDASRFAVRAEGLGVAGVGGAPWCACCATEGMNRREVDGVRKLGRKGSGE